MPVSANNCTGVTPPPPHCASLLANVSTARTVVMSGRPAAEPAAVRTMPLGVMPAAAPVAVRTVPLGVIDESKLLAAQDFPFNEEV